LVTTLTDIGLECDGRSFAQKKRFYFGMLPLRIQAFRRSNPGAGAVLFLTHMLPEVEMDFTDDIAGLWSYPP